MRLGLRIRRLVLELALLDQGEDVLPGNLVPVDRQRRKIRPGQERRSLRKARLPRQQVCESVEPTEDTG